MLSIREANGAERSTLDRLLPTEEPAAASVSARSVGLIRCDSGSSEIPDSLQTWRTLIYPMPANASLDAPCWQQITRLKNIYSGSLIIWPAESMPYQQADWVPALMTLGFRVLKQGDAWGMKYDIADYKSVPDWLNPRHWAHPERWNKARW